jgi:hypothetical protein
VRLGEFGRFAIYDENSSPGSSESIPSLSENGDIGNFTEPAENATFREVKSTFG